VRRVAGGGALGKFLPQYLDRLRKVAPCPGGKMRKVGLESGCHRGIIAAEPEKRKANMARKAAMAP
jgi:hypothetical protein